MLIRQTLQAVLFSLFLFLSGLILFTVGYAEIIADGSIGTAGTITTGIISETYGRKNGGNWFHSFSRFNVYDGESAIFTYGGPGIISNIIARVTEEASQINGGLYSMVPKANLFFVNPHGVMIGPDAIISVNGSFHLSTADYIRLTDGSRFSASGPSSSTLSSAPPAAFGFLSNNPKDIIVEGIINSGPGEPLSLIAGDIEIKDGTVWGGEQVSILSLKSPGEAFLTKSGPDVSDFAEFGDISISGENTYVLLNEYKDEKAEGIHFRGNDMKITEGALVISGTHDNTGGVIDISLSGDLSINSRAKIQTSTVAPHSGKSGNISIYANRVDIIGEKSEIKSTPDTESFGLSGDISIHAEYLNVTKNGSIKTDNNNSNNAGSITITARKSVNVSDNGVISASALAQEGDGNAGNITILVSKNAFTDSELSDPETDADIILPTDQTAMDNSDSDDVAVLTIADGGQIRSISLSEGDSGTVDIQTDRLEVLNEGVILTDSSGSGNAGAIRIAARESVIVADDSLISASSWGENAGKAGNISINVSQNAFDDSVPSAETEIIVPADDTAIAETQDDSGVLTLVNGGVIQSVSCGEKGSGDIDIQADRLEVLKKSAILTESYGAGDAGSMKIRARKAVTVADSSSISTRAVSDSEICVDAEETDDDLILPTHETDDDIIVPTHKRKGAAKIVIVPDDSTTPEQKEVSGNAGSINLQTAELTVKNDSAIFTDSQGAGDAGSITITAQNAVTVADASVISASSLAEESGKAGNISINVSQNAFDDPVPSAETELIVPADDTAIAETQDDSGVLTLVNGGVIQSVSCGEKGSGDIDIQTDRLEVLKKSAILTESYGAGDAGSMKIRAQKAVTVADSSSISTRAVSDSEICADDEETDDDLILPTHETGDNIILPTHETDLTDIIVPTHKRIRGTPKAAKTIIAPDDSAIPEQKTVSGDAGSISLQTAELTVKNDSAILTDSQGAGNAGSVSITARDAVTVADGSVISASSLSEEGRGKAGDIRITVNAKVFDEIVIDEDVTDEDIILPADQTDQIATDLDENSGVLTLSGGGVIQSVSSGGAAGDIDLTMNRLDVLNESYILADSQGNGNAGSITIMSRDAVTITDGSMLSASSLAEEGGGNAGDIAITIDADAFDNRVPDDDTDIILPTDLAETERNENSGVLTVADNSIIQSGSKGEGSAGDIDLQSNRLEVSDRSAILTDAEGSGNAGDITITARDAVTAANESVISASSCVNPDSADSPEFDTACSSDNGCSGDISITIAQDIPADSANTDMGEGLLTVSGGSVIQSINAGDIPGGNIDLKLNRVDVLNEGAVIADNYGSGKGGAISVTARDAVHVSGAGRISATSKSSGNGGDAGGVSIIVTGNASGDAKESADGSEERGLVSVTDNGMITSGSLGGGQGGDILIETDRLNVDRGYISSSVRGSGDGGTITVKADETVAVAGSGLDDQGGPYGEYYGIYAQTLGSGNGGHIDIDTKTMTVTQDGMINGQAYNNGRGGDVTLNLETLDLTQGGTVTVSTRGAGRAGNIEINVARAVNVSGQGVKLPASQIYSATHSGGDGGNIFIQTPDLKITQNGSVFAKTLGDDTYSGPKLPDGNAGNIKLDVERLKLNSGGAVLAGSECAGRGGNIEIKAADSVHISERALGGYNPAGVESSGVYARAQSSGHGGRITIETPSIGMTEYGQINTSSTGSGRAGDIDLETWQLVMHSGSTITSQSGGSGAAGSVAIDAGREIEMRNSTISTEAGSNGNAGNIDLNTPQLVMHSDSTVTSQSGGSGAAGSIDINAGKEVQMRDSAISTEADGSGNAGNIDLKTHQLVMHSDSRITSQSNASGSAGSVDIDAGAEIRIQRSAISTEAKQNDGGSITVKTPVLEITDNSTVNASVLGGKGRGGGIDIDVQTLDVNHGGRIESSTAGAGPGGVVSINASNTVALAGLPEERTSGFFSTSEGAGGAGRISVETPQMTLLGNTSVSTSASGNGKGGNIDLNVNNLGMNQGASIAAKSTGTGDAGSITVHASNRIQAENSSITTAALHADGGNINLHPDYMLYLIDSDVTASVQGGKGDGGNITVSKPKFAILNDSDVIANAYGGKGGNIDIQADYFLGSAESVVDASSALGIDGVVNVDALDADVSGSVTALPETFADEDTLVNKRCDIYRRSGASALFISGRGGLPVGPDDYLPNIWY